MRDGFGKNDISALLLSFQSNCETCILIKINLLESFYYTEISTSFLLINLTSIANTSGIEFLENL